MSAGGRRDRSQHQPSGLGPAVLPKDLRLIRQKSQTVRRGSSPAATPCTSHNGSQSSPISHNWDEVLTRANSPAAHPLCCIPWEISRHFPGPKQVSMGQQSIVAQYMHHTVVVQMRTTLMCPQSTQTLGAPAVVPAFQTGCVYWLEDLGLDPWHTHPPVILMLHMSILLPMDLSKGDLAVASPLYHLLKEVSECQSYHITSNFHVFHELWTLTLTNVTKRSTT